MTNFRAFQKMCGGKSLFRHRPNLQHTFNIKLDQTKHIQLTVVFSTCSDTFLGIECALQLGHFRVWVNGAQEDGFVLLKI